MADEPNIFSPDPVNEDVTADILIGDGKKYKDANDLAKAYVNADTHIGELRRDLLAAKAELDVLKTNSTTRPNDVPGEDTQQRQDPPHVDPNIPSPKVNEEEFRDTLRREVEALDQEKRASQNAEAAAQRLVEHYGDAAKANEAVRRRAQELGVSTEWLRDAAAKSPQAFYASMGIDQNATSRSSPAPRNDFVPDRQNMRGAKKYSDFEELRKTNKVKYYSPETQREMQELAREQGSAFYS